MKLDFDSMDRSLKEFEAQLGQLEEMHNRIGALIGRHRKSGPKGEKDAETVVANARARYAQSRNGAVPDIEDRLEGLGKLQRKTARRIWAAMHDGENSAEEISQRAGYSASVSAYNGLRMLEKLRLIRHEGKRYVRVGVSGNGASSVSTTADPEAIFAKLRGFTQSSARRMYAVLTDEPLTLVDLAKAAKLAPTTRPYKVMRTLTKLHLAKEGSGQGGTATWRRA